MLKKSQIKAIVFDIGGVLQLGKYSKPIRGHRERGVHEFIAKKLNISLDQYFDSLDTAYAKSIEGKIPEKKAIQIISSNLKITSKKLKQLFKQAYKKHFKLNKKLIDFSKKLKKNHKFAILSDQWYLSKKTLITKEIKSVFKPILISCEQGIRKPNPKFYKLLLKKIKIPAKQVLFIDNQSWNIKPAKKLGFKTILFKNNQDFFKKIKKILKWSQ